jgi:hypothetical protein
LGLQETEILDRLRQSTKEAVDSCKIISVSWERGSAYENLRDNLHMIDGCCRQMAMYRDDARWLPFGVFAANMHQRAGDWLRGYKDNGVLVTYYTQTKDRQRPLNAAFIKLAAELTVILEGLEKLAVMKTGIRGMILPATPSEERRAGRPGFVNTSKNPGLIIPGKYRTI